uniref:Uncharacterized protein n=1 Tax=Zea mays TaxID=4577 RepID=B6SPQ6_MAIZE|nr:hypothetical protein [Zea mays]
MPARHSTTCPSVLWRSPAVRVESLVWCSPSNSVVIAVRFRASRNQRSSVGDQEIKLFEFYKVEVPEHLFGEGDSGCFLSTSP